MSGGGIGFGCRMGLGRVVTFFLGVFMWKELQD